VEFRSDAEAKRLRVTAHGEARQSPGVDEEAKSLRRRYRRFRAAQNRFDCPLSLKVDRGGEPAIIVMILNALSGTSTDDEPFLERGGQGLKASSSGRWENPPRVGLGKER
jgi:hypothetical protein